MRAGAKWRRLLAVGLLLAAASWVRAEGPPATPPVSKDFPFDPDDRRPDRFEGPYAHPQRGRPGLVTSPYAPDAGYIDVRGY